MEFYQSQFQRTRLKNLLSTTRKEEIKVDLIEQKISYGNNEIKFDIDDFKKECLIEGYDDIALSLNHKSKIQEFENKIKSKDHGYLMIKVKKKNSFITWRRNWARGYRRS